MKDNLFHICITSEYDVLFRKDEDYRRVFNSLALAVFETKSTLLAYAIMSNHIHVCVQTNALSKLISKLQRSYDHYFKYKYDQSRILKDSDHMIIEIKGLRHCQTAISYILRNPLHHGVSITPFAYEYSSINAYFRKEMDNSIVMPSKYISKKKGNVCHTRHVPKELYYDNNGQLSIDCIIDSNQVEMIYGTVQDFMFDMARRSTKKWREDQEVDANGSDVVTLEMLESPKYTGNEMEKNERGKFSVTGTTDKRICEIIDNELINNYGLKSIYEANLGQKLEMARYLHYNFKSSVSQLARCLAVRDNEFYKNFYNERRS